RFGRFGTRLLKIQVAQKKFKKAFENADSSLRVELIPSKINLINLKTLNLRSFIGFQSGDGMTAVVVAMVVMVAALAASGFWWRLSRVGGDSRGMVVVVWCQVVAGGVDDDDGVRVAVAVVC
nr:hypothetical protein [Tanacetum cinerariifolium]